MLSSRLWIFFFLFFSLLFYKMSGKDLSSRSSRKNQRQMEIQSIPTPYHQGNFNIETSVKIILFIILLLFFSHNREFLDLLGEISMLLNEFSGLKHHRHHKYDISFYLQDNKEMSLMLDRMFNTILDKLSYEVEKMFWNEVHVNTTYRTSLVTLDVNTLFKLLSDEQQEILLNILKKAYNNTTMKTLGKCSRKNKNKRTKSKKSRKHYRKL